MEEIWKCSVEFDLPNLGRLMRSGVCRELSLERYERGWPTILSGVESPVHGGLYRKTNTEVLCQYGSL